MWACAWKPSFALVLVRSTIFWKPTQSAQLAAGQGMRRRSTRLSPTDVQDAAIEIYLLPPEVHQLSRPEPMAEGQQNHGCVPVACRCLDQPLDLGLGQVLT